MQAWAMCTLKSESRIIFTDERYIQWDIASVRPRDSASTALLVFHNELRPTRNLTRVDPFFPQINRAAYSSEVHMPALAFLATAMTFATVFMGIVVSIMV